MRKLAATAAAGQLGRQGLDAQQLRAFLDHSAHHRMHTALWVAANTGLRRGELAGLHWGDLDLDERRLSVNRSLVSVGYEMHESRGKTRTSRRCVDLDSATVAMLGNWRARRTEEHADFDPADRVGYVFARPDGSQVGDALLWFVLLESPRTLPRGLWSVGAQEPSRLVCTCAFGEVSRLSGAAGTWAVSARLEPRRAPRRTGPPLRGDACEHQPRATWRPRPRRS